MTKILKYSVFILPVLFFLAGINMHKAKYANDPEYIYLVNATAICDGKFVGHIDNPGTTVMQIGAATIAIKHLFSNPENEPIVQHVFKEPDRFVRSIRFGFLVLNSLVLLLLAWVTVKKTGSLWLAILLQASTFITSNTLDHVWTKMSPEPVLFLVSCLFVITILNFYAEKEKTRWKYVIVFALLAGAGLGTKATFLPLVIFPFVVLPTIKKKIIYLLGIIPSFVLFTIPAIPEYKNMYFWFRGLISHSGKYGHGEKELVDIETYFPNIIKIITNNPIFAFVLILAIFVVLLTLFQSFRKKTKPDWDVRILSGLIASSGFGVLLVAKHYHFNHYLIPILLLTGISLFFVLNILFKTKLHPMIKKLIPPIIVVGLIIFIGFKQTTRMKYASHGYQITNEEMDSTNVKLERDFADYSRIYFYPFSFYKYSALNFGDVYTKRQMLPYLKKLYPNTYFYDFYWNRLQYWNADVLLEDIIEYNGNKILMVGGPRDEKMAGELTLRGIPLKKIYKGRIQAFYEIDTLKLIQIGKEKIVVEQVFCDAEILSNDNQNFIGSDRESFGNAFMRNDEFFRSGKHSIKMDEKTEFAIEYKLDGLKAGNNYEVEVWRKSNNYSGRLVVASINSKVFYQSQNDFITSDKYGWDLIRIKFTVTQEMEKEILKIYLWNPQKKLAWFDDLTIKKIIYKDPVSNPAF
ncbi:MAG: hypothetical protein HN778_19155 [Prolixibacteraceae bacterium]|nr:hypothetical protein [Prolixibacteraceae bacterium]MBT6006361.1 hypothetical protein [Prolixibacteraceae bacterium]MBT6765296.1 hypothetical protein [Prolixibacteraceae bacterium]MBT6996916.1 hypothetical protein [Prolixibacteraceae bacterium]MBT7396956.1 hypothetical protein [Prolixibacteraceae bacterium]